MSRLKKLLTVGLILGTGIGLAWPFRKTDSHTANSPASDAQQQSIEFANSSPARHVVAKMASTSNLMTTSSHKAGFDMANHPVVANQRMEASITPTIDPYVTPSRTKKPVARPTYATADHYLGSEGDAELLSEVFHVVRNTDTLEKLAERYLGDGGRALEIFDLNREQLENPHLLPIGAKLRIPADPVRMID